LQLTVCEYGATITSVKSRSRDGVAEELTLGWGSAHSYCCQDLVANPGYFGVTAGRYANRINKGKFSVDGVDYTLTANNGENHLHGGTTGFDKKLWRVSTPPPACPGRCVLRLSLLSPDGDQGYPGDLETTVTFTLTAEDEIIIDYWARTTKATPVNLTNHAYWNLSGDCRRSVAVHRLHASCSHYIPVDSRSLIPTGEIASVKGTPFDFTASLNAGARSLIGPRLPLIGGGADNVCGLDHCFVIDHIDQTPDNADTEENLPALFHAVALWDIDSGRRMDLSCSQPGVQVYTGNFLPASEEESEPSRFTRHNAVCLETQHFPDSPNQPTFPSSILRPEETYLHRAKFCFSYM
ncbi:unnamed protein product, partial [Ectocarpus fasciculatus]